jgi:pyruvate kinase
MMEKTVQEGERVRFSLTPGRGRIPLPHREIFEAVEPGDTLSCDDGRLRFRVTDREGGSAGAIALAGGILRGCKGINLVEHPVVLKDLTGADVARIRGTRHLGDISYAFSFMKDGDEAGWIRRRAPGCPVVGKVERREALANMDGLGRAVDALWICRGDLGAQVGMVEMARWVSGYDPRGAPCPVLMAGQVLEHMTSHADPTRAEVCHLHDLVRRGYAGFVLSDETAIGTDPARAVRTLRSLIAGFLTG